MKASHPETRILNGRISHLEASVNQIAADLRLKGEPLTAAEIKQLCIDGSSSASLVELMMKHNYDLLRRIGRDYHKY